MNSAELLAEFDAYERALRQQHLEHVRRLGLLEGIAQVGQHQPPAGMAHIRTLPNALWEPDDAGTAAMILPVCRWTVFDAFGIEIETPELVDLIAFRTSSPASWLWRTGTGWALGEDQLIFPNGDPLLLVSTPLEWLRAGGTAVCLLDWSASSPAWAHLLTSGELLTDTPHLAARIDRALRQSIRLPRVEVAHAA
ncbi:hypothetical protein [Altericroceibacterium xinjiangense]|uniref:hypothetical protein n=1 Tax=Altericroceibacterium xinjiangense TaxID=762261 RepID=UPI000F7EC7DB|nr:hypothetical protein [Altericroceibacterium xinjiangense]